MKRLFSFMAIAMVAVAAFAFTPKSAAFDNTYSFGEFGWEQTPGDCQTPGTDICEFTSVEALTSAEAALVEQELIASPTTGVVNIDSDGNPANGKEKAVTINSFRTYDRP